MFKFINKIFPIFMMLFMSVSLFTACGSEDEEISYLDFCNETSDVSIYYGIKFGDAEYVGVLNPYDDTYNYSPGERGYETESGSYYVKMMDSSGTWNTVSSDSLSVRKDKIYDLEICGSLSGGIYFVLYEYTRSIETQRNLKEDKVFIKEIYVSPERLAEIFKK